MADPTPHGSEPHSAPFGTVMLLLLLLSIVYAVAVYFDWYRILPGM